MDQTERLIAMIQEQEQMLQFPRFTNDMALELGLKLAARAQQEGLPITVDITRCGQQLFHFAAEGTSPDNDQWILRKNRVVNRFGKSSLLMGLLLQMAGKTLEEKYLLPAGEYAAHGGAFPLTIRGVGVVGTITVSGLPQKEDHALVTAVIRDYLSLGAEDEVSLE